MRGKRHTEVKQKWKQKVTEWKGKLPLKASEAKQKLKCTEEDKEKEQQWKMCRWTQKDSG